MKLKNLLLKLTMGTLILGISWTHVESQAQLRGDLRDLRGIEADFDDHYDRPLRSETITLNLRGEIFGDRNGRINPTLFLKKEILNRHPRLPIDQMELEEVTVVGNSESRRFSSSTVSLYVGDRFQDSARIQTGDYTRRRADVVDLRVRDSRLSSGRVTWQLEFDETTRVDQVIVRYSLERRPTPPPVRLRSLGAFKAQKAVIVPVTLTVRDVIDTIHIRGVEKQVSIERVEATLTNGRRILLNMRGHVSAGQILRENLRQDLAIDSLEIHATSVDLIGSRGVYEVLVGVSRRR